MINGLGRTLLLFLLVCLCHGHNAVCATPDPIIIRRKDVLEIHIVDQTGMDLLLRKMDSTSAFTREVSPDGRIYLPNIGTLTVAGKTPVEVEEQILRFLPPRVLVKEVTVILSKQDKKFNRVYVLGEVSNPGFYEIDKYDKFKNRLFNLLGKAGGLTERADKTKIRVISKDGKQLEVNVLSLNDVSSEVNISLNDEDTVIVDQSVGKVYVLGEVRSPGGKPYLYKASYSDYIAEAEGTTSGAALDNISIVRKVEKGKALVHKVRISGEYTEKARLPFELLPGDMIYVSKHVLADWKDIGTILGLTRDAVFTYDILRQ